MSVDVELSYAASVIEPHGQVWVNNKNGNDYVYIGVGRHSETLDILVTYLDKEGNLWYRPWELFLEKFTPSHPNYKVGDEIH